jgi:hypothetical protein
MALIYTALRHVRHHVTVLTSERPSIKATTVSAIDEDETLQTVLSQAANARVSKAGSCLKDSSEKPEAAAETAGWGNLILKLKMWVVGDQ